MNKDNYDISITGRQTVGDESDEINLFTTGEYEQNGNIGLVSYWEYDDDEPDNPHLATLQIEGEKVLLARTDSDTKLILEKGRRHLCLYDTGFGSITLGVFTSDVSSTLNKSGGELRIKYTLDIDSNFSSSNEINLTIKPKKPLETLLQQ